MHIKSFGFRGLRKLYLNHDLYNHNFHIDSINQFQASTINIVVGPNGGGKSTVVDLVRAMGDADVLRTIARENIKIVTSSGFVVFFDNGVNVKAEFNKPGIDEFGVSILSSSNAEFSGSLYKDVSVPLPDKLRDVIDSLNVTVGYRRLHDEDQNGIPIQKFIDALNADGIHLSGLAPFPLENGQDAYKGPPGFPLSHALKSPIQLIENDLVRVSFNDDEMQTNHVPIDKFPSGWRAFGGLLAWLSMQGDGSICVIEEPETHIHPKLLRVLMQRISELVTTKRLQIFMTTHSSTLIDIHTWPNTNVKLFEADGYQLRELTAPSLALANLGVRPSDVCQANGVIWVEGSSDRQYILHWLRLWCIHNGKTLPIENIQFSFLFYGGSMLNHFSGARSTDLIEIFSINQNSVVVMDRDLDFEVDENGHTIPKSTMSAKAKMCAEISSFSCSGGYCWVTQNYTIENYLPSEFRDKYYVMEDERLKPITSMRKTVVAEVFRRDFKEFDLSFEPGSDLSQRIEELYDAIMRWNA